MNSYAQGLALGLGHPSACPCRGAADIACGINFVTYPCVNFQQRTRFIHFAFPHTFNKVAPSLDLKYELAKCAETILWDILYKYIQVNLAQHQFVHLVYSELGNFDYARSKSKCSYTNIGLKDETKTEYIVLTLYYHFKKTNMNTGNNLPQKSLHLKVLCMFFMTIHNQVLENRRMLGCAFFFYSNLLCNKPSSAVSESDGIYC